MGIVYLWEPKPFKKFHSHPMNKLWRRGKNKKAALLPGVIHRMTIFQHSHTVNCFQEWDGFLKVKHNYLGVFTVLLSFVFLNIKSKRYFKNSPVENVQSFIKPHNPHLVQH